MTRLPALALVVALLPLACGPTAKPRTQPVSPKAEAPAVLKDGDWGRFRSQRQGLSIPLPEGKTWRIDDHSDRWLDARHPATATRLRARTWIEPKPVNRDHCEAEARRLAPDLPVVDEHGAIDDHVSSELFAPDFSSHVIVGVNDADPKSGALEGYVLVFGAAARRCVVLSFTTQVNGPKGSAVLGERLELGTRIAENTIYVSRMPDGPFEPIATPAAR
jgi:hypothetical protein